MLERNAKLVCPRCQGQKYDQRSCELCDNTGFIMPCEEPGCNNINVTRCRLHDYKTNTDEWNYYCFEHAYKNGFCWGCGEFWSGIENFDFHPSHLCENCRESEYDDDYEDEDG